MQKLGLGRALLAIESPANPGPALLLLPLCGGPIGRHRGTSPTGLLPALAGRRPAAALRRSPPGKRAA